MPDLPQPPDPKEPKRPHYWCEDAGLGSEHCPGVCLRCGLVAMDDDGYVLSITDLDAEGCPDA